MPILALANFICALLAYSFLAYALARLHWRRRGIVLVLFAIALCGQVWMIPQAISTLGFAWNITLYPLWFGNWLGTVFSIILLAYFLRDVPRDLEDTGRLDGFGFWRVYWHIVLPLVRRALLFIALFVLMATWTVFLAPLLARSNLPAISQLQPAARAEFDLFILIAASLLLTLPVIGIFFLSRRDLFPNQRLEKAAAR
jgi:multiple sugar transport system permease protein